MIFEKEVCGMNDIKAIEISFWVFNIIYGSLVLLIIIILGPSLLGKKRNIRTNSDPDGPPPH
jgi:hypothetical protein